MNFRPVDAQNPGPCGGRQAGNSCLALALAHAKGIPPAQVNFLDEVVGKASTCTWGMNCDEAEKVIGDLLKFLAFQAGLTQGMTEARRRHVQGVQQLLAFNQICAGLSGGSNPLPPAVGQDAPGPEFLTRFAQVGEKMQHYRSNCHTLSGSLLGQPLKLELSYWSTEIPDKLTLGLAQIKKWPGQTIACLDYGHPIKHYVHFRVTDDKARPPKMEQIDYDGESNPGGTVRWQKLDVRLIIAVVLVP